MLDDINKLVQKQISPSLVVVNLYNGNKIVYKGSSIKSKIHGNPAKKIPYYSTFDLMQKCASSVRVSSDGFRISLLTDCKLQTFLLPYNKNIAKIRDCFLYYRIFIITPSKVQKVYHNDPETFRYLFYQSKSDFILILKENRESEELQEFLLSNFGLLLAALAKRLNIQFKRSMYTRILQYLSITDLTVWYYLQNNLDKVLDRCMVYLAEYPTAQGCEFVFIENVLNHMTSKERLNMHFEATLNHVSGEAHKDANAQPFTDKKFKLHIQPDVVHIETSLISKDISYPEFKCIKLLKRKRKTIEIETKHNGVFTVEFSTSQIGAMDSCLALLDLFARVHEPSRFLLRPYCWSVFDNFSTVYNELNQSWTLTNMFNLISKSTEPLDYLGLKQGQKLLTDLNKGVGSYAIFRMNSPSIYARLYILLDEENNMVLHARIINKEGSFWVDESARNIENPNKRPLNRYQSLGELMSGIRFSVKTKHVEIVPTLRITEEMISDMRKKRLGYYDEFDPDEHQRSYCISSHSLSLLKRSEYSEELVISLHHGSWLTPDNIRKDVMVSVINTKYLDRNSIINMKQKIADFSQSDFIHENVLRCYGFTIRNYSLSLVYESFGIQFLHSFVREHSNERLFDFGNQIKTGLQYLHDRDIVHGFPALHNIFISRHHIKLANIGVLSSVLCRPEGKGNVYDCAASSQDTKFQALKTFLAGWFSKKRIKRLQTEEKQEEIWDRYVFGCTLWQLYNNGATPLGHVTDQDLLDKLEGNECWTTSGSIFRLPHRNTEFHKKLQKIINVCVTWGSKDNQNKYQFRKIADMYEKLEDVVNVEQPTSLEYIIKAGDGNLDFDVIGTDLNNFKKYTQLQSTEKDMVIVVNNKMNNLNEDLSRVKLEANDKGVLLSLTDLQGLDGGTFAPPPPGEKEVEAILSTKSSFTSSNVWVKSFYRCKELPEEDFTEEIGNLLKFQHRNIIPLKGCIIHDNILLLITPCYKLYGSLRDYLDNNADTVPGSLKETYVRQICSGMRYLSERNCIHRQLSLNCIYVTHRSSVVISNFGLARVADTIYYQQQRNLTSDTFLAYPPEVVAVLCSGAKVKFTVSCDVWSFGVVVWELYSGSIAYQDMLTKPDINLLHSYFLEGYKLECSDSWPNKVKSVVEKCLTYDIPRLSFQQLEDILSQCV